MSLSDKMDKLVDGLGIEHELFYKRNVKEFIKDILNVCEKNDVDVIVTDFTEKGDITISLSDYIKQRAGDELL